jgi:hypothetical protein
MLSLPSSINYKALYPHPDDLLNLKSLSASLGLPKRQLLDLINGLPIGENESKGNEKDLSNAPSTPGPINSNSIKKKSKNRNKNKK